MQEYTPTRKDFTNPYFRKHLLLSWVTDALGIAAVLMALVGFYLVMIDLPYPTFDYYMATLTVILPAYLLSYVFTYNPAKRYYKSNKGDYYICSTSLDDTYNLVEIPNTKEEKQAVLDNLHRVFSYHIKDLAENHLYPTPGTAYLAYDLPVTLEDLVKFHDFTTSIGTEITLVQSLPNPLSYTPYIYRKESDGTYVVYSYPNPEPLRTVSELPPIHALINS